MKFIIRKILVLLLFGQVALAGIGRLDPQLGRYVLFPEKAKHLALQKGAGEPDVRVIITFDGRRETLRDAGIHVVAVLGDLAVADVPLSRLEELSDLPGVIYVEASHPDRAYLDRSVPAIRADLVQEDLGVTGRGVLIGIIDSGIDWRHEDFRRADGTTRIKAILDLSQPGSVYGGTLYTEQDINDALQGIGSLPQEDRSGHGTHVAGIAAGDGSEGPGYGPFAGVAPEAELVIVKATREAGGSEFETADQIVALSFIDSVATALGRPYVANLSFGGHYGAHDGTSPVERAIDRLVGHGIPGKAVVTVAGNDRDENLHARTALSGSQTVAEITFAIGSYTAQAGVDNDKIQLDGWYDGEEKISVTITTPSGIKVGPIRYGDYIDKKTEDGGVYVWNGLYESGGYLHPGVNTFNGDNELFIQISDDQSYRPPKEGTWTIRLAGTGGTIDIWKSYATIPFEFVQGASETGKVSIPGTAENSVTVAAFISKKSWEDFDGNHLTIDNRGRLQVGDMTDFSSPGPTRDDRIKPDLAAPGQIIASSLSEAAWPSEPASIFVSSNAEFPNAFVMAGGRQGLSSGTSMAAPHVAGVIALLLERYPQATAVQLRDMLTQTAKTDRFVGEVPNPDWGWGKTDAFAAIQLTPGEEAPTTYRLMNAYPNPFSVSTTIEFELPVVPSEQKTRIRIYNILGQQVRELLSAVKSAKKHQVFWDGRDQDGYLLASGVYFVELVSGDHREVEKLVFVGASGQ